MVWRISGFTIGLLLVSMAPASSQNRASFDCSKAKEDIEKAICKSASLSTLDRQVAAAYGDARKRLDPIAQKALKNDQELFLVGRDIALVEQGGSLSDFMKTRVKLLLSLQAGSTAMGAAAFLGEWKNENGSMTIAKEKGDDVSIKVFSAAMVTGKWVCEIEATAPFRAGRIAFTDEKVLIGITREGGALKVSEKSPPDESQKPYCGHNGGIAGHYFKVK